MSNSATEITKKVKHSQIETKDRLSDLPDCVIIHILSFLNIKRAIRTCVLSSRWKNLWKLLPELTFNSKYFRNWKSFMKFVSRVLSLRDPSISLQALDFKHDGKTGLLEPSILKMIMKYAISHNVRSCWGHKTPFPKSFNLPALTSLQLENFKFCAGNKVCAEPFSALNTLNSLFISNCTVSGARTLCISSVTLVNLTLYNEFLNNFYIIELCTPSLCTFAFTGTPYQKLSGSNVSSLKHVEIYAKVMSNQKKPPWHLFSWLQEFPNIKSLTVSATTLQVLYFIPGLLKTNYRSLTNLESLKVKLKPLSYRLRMILCRVMLKKVNSKKEAANLRRAFRKGSEPSSLIPDGIIDFLLQNSPSAKVDFIDCPKQPTRLTHL
ncbi:F-box/LRR-repeat protein [Trifolium repens]|nr:F-box/LRR-repeat protein [Trifolium repens]